MIIQGTFLAASMGAGAALGLFYFSGLWWTVQRVSRAKSPPLWLMASFTVRAGVCLLGFYMIMGDGPVKLLSAFLGFLLARMVMVRFLRPRKMPAPGFKAEKERAEDNIGWENIDEVSR